MEDMNFYHEPARVHPRNTTAFLKDSPKGTSHSQRYVNIPTNLPDKLLNFLSFVYLRNHDILGTAHWFWVSEISPPVFLRMLPYAASEIMQEKLGIPRANQIHARLSFQFLAQINGKSNPEHIEAIFEDYLKSFLR